ncbi:MAG: hypothetical protein ABI689_11525 [Thermoanaerobaculia bacterium]
MAKRTILWGSACRAPVDDPCSGRPRGVGALGAACSFFGLPAYPDHDPLGVALGATELYLLLSQRFPELHPRVRI